jgi:predicted ATPase
MAFLYVYDPYISSGSYLALSLFALGYPEQAVARQREVLVRARELDHPASLAYALSFACFIAQLGRDRQGAEHYLELLIPMTREQGFEFWLAPGTICRGWILAGRSQLMEGIYELRQGLMAYQATGSEASMTYFLALLAEAHGAAGQAAEGEELLAAALERVERTGERYYEAELHRLRGEMLLALPERDRAEAEICLRRALVVARDQDARMWELRAATSLARLWRDQNRSVEAVDLLAPIYAWFTEGFDTINLKEAKALLDELRSPPVSSTFRRLHAV